MEKAQNRVDDAYKSHKSRNRAVRRRANDPILYRHNTIDKCWKILDRFLDDSSIPDKDKIFVAMQIGIKEYDHNSKIELQKLKGAQDVSKNLFLVEALKKAEQFNRTLKNKGINAIAVNAGRKIDTAIKDNVEVTEADFSVISKEDTDMSCTVKTIKGREEAQDRKYKGNY